MVEGEKAKLKCDQSRICIFNTRAYCLTKENAYRT